MVKPVVHFRFVEKYFKVVYSLIYILSPSYLFSRPNTQWQFCSLRVSGKQISYENGQFLLCCHIHRFFYIFYCVNITTNMSVYVGITMSDPRTEIGRKFQPFRFITEGIRYIGNLDFSYDKVFKRIIDNL